MKSRTWISNVTKSVLTVAVMAFAADAYADGYVEIFNHTQQRICFGKITSFTANGEPGSLSEGWTCVDPSGSYKFDIGLNDYVYVNAIDDQNNDFLEYRLNNYPSIPTWAPTALVDKFGVATIEHANGTFGYAFYLGDNEWSHDMLTGSREGNDNFIAQEGFRKITGRVFRGADYPGGLAVSINF